MSVGLTSNGIRSGRRAEAGPIPLGFGLLIGAAASIFLWMVVIRLALNLFG